MLASHLMMETSIDNAHQLRVQAALRRLNVDHLVLIVFDAALPQVDGFDVGTGSPYSERAREFFAFAKRLGFTGIQFGPQGAVSRQFASPYDGTVFSRNPLSIALDTLACSPELEQVDASLAGGLLPIGSRERVMAADASRTAARVDHPRAYDRHGALLREVVGRLSRAARLPEFSPLWQRFETWRRTNSDWLLADALYDLLCSEHGIDDYCRFPDTPQGRLDRQLWQVESPAGTWTRQPQFAPRLLDAPLQIASRLRLAQLSGRFAHQLEHYAWAQFLAAEQHLALRRWARDQQLELFGDLHVGYSRRDVWHYESVFLKGYCVGAPPSRTNPDGQPWGYPTLDPDRFFTAEGHYGPALKLLDRRAEKLFSDYDRVRVDHPHGLICPWVYRSDTDNSLRAVQSGARLFSSPDLPDHPELARHALVGANSLDKSQARHADGWIRALDASQVRRFSTEFEVLARHARSRGGTDRLICEVLSTQPRELGAVMRSYDLGRFRVTQKADVENPEDVYLSRNANPEDWVLMGNHDTLPIWAVVERWRNEGRSERQAQYLASRLAKDEQAERKLMQALRGDPCALVHAQCADLFASESRNVFISFSDLFGLQQPYNVPGTISDENWTQRLPADFEQVYAARVAEGRALDLERALFMALERLDRSDAA